MRNAFSGFWKQTGGILLFALLLRLFLAFISPQAEDDSMIYEAFAKNLVNFGTYSHLPSNTAPQPTLIRVPGYPLMLAAAYALTGSRYETATRITQSLLDTFTCLLVALIAFEISGGDEKRRRRIAQWALLLAALCPFIANYSASILTEVPTTFLLTAATLFGLRALKYDSTRKYWFYCGLLAGAATLFRPESGLLIGAFILILLIKHTLRRTWRPLIINSALMTGSLLLVLTPWAIRNALTIGTFQMLAPTYAQDPDERVNVGYLSWCRTWLWTYEGISTYMWPMGSEDMPSESLPAGSVDSELERKTVATLYSDYNSSGHNLTVESDNVFGQIAANRRHKHPFRFYIGLPLLRSLAMWMTPRVEVLNLDRRLLPPKEAWSENRIDFSVSLFLFLLNAAYLALAVCGAISVLRRYCTIENFECFGGFVLVAILVLRTAFLAYFFFPEPRYILETYPCILILAAFVFAKKQALE